MRNGLQSMAAGAKARFAGPLSLVALLWLGSAICLGMPDRWTRDYVLGRPRSRSGLSGIVTHPLCHSSLGHIAANSIWLIVLGWLVGLRRPRLFLAATIMSWFVGGVGIWLIGRGPIFHRGASGIVYGYLGFLLLRGFFDRRFLSVLFSLLGMFLFPLFVWGMLPTASGTVSWEGHLSGFVGGGLCAYLVARREQRSREFGSARTGDPSPLEAPPSATSTGERMAAEVEEELQQIKDQLGKSRPSARAP